MTNATQKPRVASPATEQKTRHAWRTPAITATVFFIIFYFPFLVLGQNSYIFIGDNLDSEIIFNKLNAKYFFDFKGNAPEIMGGVDIRAINSFAPVQLVFYMFLPAFWAYTVNDFITRAFAFFGMYLLMSVILAHLTKNATPARPNTLIALATAVMFAATPFFSVYGLSVMGLPLLALSFYTLYRTKTERTKTGAVLAYAYVVFYTVSSSLLLTGIFLVVGLVVMCAVSLSHKKMRARGIHFYILTFVMVAIYLACNLKIITLMFSGYESHREIWNKSGNIEIGNKPPANPFIIYAWFLYILFFGHIHARSFHLVIVFLCFAVLITKQIHDKKNARDTQNPLRVAPAEPNTRSAASALAPATPLTWLISIASAIAITSAILFSYQASVVLSFFHLSSFNFFRIFHFLTPIWYVAGGIALLILYDAIKARAKKYSARVANATVIAVTAVSVLFSVSVMEWYTSEPYITNWGHMVGYKSKTTPTYEQFYDTKLFDEIADHIEKTDGLKRTEYRVASIGIYPMIAVYNGFYTADGYLQNYSLEHWEKFRNVIAGELAKDAELDAYYNWGNKNYMFSTELGDNPAMANQYGKNSGVTIKSLAYDIGAFYDLGGRYIFSAVPIENHDEIGLKYERAFEHGKSFWRIHLYKAVQ